MKTVDVLMSTYNGAKYLNQQIDSILSQKNVYTIIHIRDDGSNDDTMKILEARQRQHPQRIYVFQGENIGYQKSFLKLLKFASEKTDYYAFSDQDDYWYPEKCECAIKKIEENGEEIVLYASPVIITDENLHEIHKTDLSNMPNRLESNFARGRLAGCTFVFTPELKIYGNKFSDLNFPLENMPSHDFIISSIAFACGTVIIDDQSFILHRRHGKSVTSGGRGMWNRLKTEKTILFKRKNIRYNLANEFLKMNFPAMKLENKIFLEQVSHYKDSWKSKVLLLTNKGLTTNMLLCDLESKIKILLSNF